MKNLYFVRHGESSINVKGIWATVVGSRFDLGLSETGKRQVTAAAEQCRQQKLHFDSLIVSPLKRAQETAEILANTLSLPTHKIVTSPLVTERLYAGLDGASIDDFFKGRDYADLDPVPGNETLEALQNRAIEALSYLQTLKADTVLVVSHGAFERALQRVLHNKPYTDEYDSAVDVRHDALDVPHGKIIRLI